MSNMGVRFTGVKRSFIMTFIIVSIILIYNGVRKNDIFFTGIGFSLLVIVYIFYKIYF
ncbi:MAG: hypothetical protein ACOCP8_04130 [archaeon]